MTEEQTKNLRLDQLNSLLTELINQGYGELEYKIVIKKSKIMFITLTKTNTYQLD